MGPQSIQCPPTLAPPRCCWATPQAKPLLPPRTPSHQLDPLRQGPGLQCLGQQHMLGLAQGCGQTMQQRLWKASRGAPSQPPAPPLGPLTSQCSQQVEDRPSQLLHQRPALEHQALEDGARRTVQRLRPAGAQALLQLGTRAVSEPG